MFVGFPPSAPVLLEIFCIRDGKYSPNQEPTEAKPHSYFQGTPNPEPVLTQCLTTGPAFSASPVAGNYTPRTVAKDILCVVKRHCDFSPTDHYIAYATALYGAAQETNSSGDKYNVEVKE